MPAEPDLHAARARLTNALDSGAAWKTFVAMVEAQELAACVHIDERSASPLPRVLDVID